MADTENTSKPAGKAKAKKAKPPAPEDKPFPEFIQQEFMPSLASALQQAGVEDLELAFETKPITVAGMADPEAFPQVSGSWKQGKRQFSVVFTEDSIKSAKYFYASAEGATASTIEQFMGDERRVTLQLMVLYTVQRLNGQKWLTRN